MNPHVHQTQITLLTPSNKNKPIDLTHSEKYVKKHQRLNSKIKTPELYFMSTLLARLRLTILLRELHILETKLNTVKNYQQHLTVKKV